MRGLTGRRQPMEMGQPPSAFDVCRLVVRVELCLQGFLVFLTVRAMA
jgi:hypothetical protein